MKIRRTRLGIRQAPTPVANMILMYICVLFLLSGCLIFYTEELLRPTYEQLTDSISRKVATEAISSAMLKDISENDQADHFLKILVDHDGKVTAAQLNSIAVARLQSRITRHIQDSLDQIPPQDLSIRLGQALHNTLLSEIGPSVNVQLIAIGNATSSVDAQYQESGMNQTLNILYLNVSTEVRVVAPLLSKVIEVSTRVPMSYILLVGQVPTNFYNSAGNEFVPRSQVMPDRVPRPLPTLPKLPNNNK